jgi:hypothetical protein
MRDHPTAVQEWKPLNRGIGNICNLSYYLRRRSDIKGTSVYYISMSLECIGISGSGEAAALVSLFSTHVSKLQRRTKWPVCLEIIPSLGSARWSDFLQAEGVGQSEIHHRLVSVYGQNVFS